MVRAFGLHADSPSSYPVITSSLDLFSVVPNSTLPRFVKLIANWLPPAS